MQRTHLHGVPHARAERAVVGDEREVQQDMLKSLRIANECCGRRRCCCVCVCVCVLFINECGGMVVSDVTVLCHGGVRVAILWCVWHGSVWWCGGLVHT